ncbi:lipopolysaccharide transport periplasmic protein LptA [Advenella sp. RU8]|uniref:lipopolysaccharide transport periplasmic protein LptA n=1 Tax=Advenella sp. RU8 TaxID=3399575 RepID=UPI003AACADC5
MKSSLIKLIFPLLMLNAPVLAQVSAPATNAQPEPETLVLSDTLNYDDKTKTSVFNGNVILTRGQMRLTSDTLKIQEDAQGFQHGTATVNSGKVRIFEERPETYETIRSEGDRAEYNGKNDTVKMIGHAIVNRYICGRLIDTIRGEVVIYNNKNNTYAAQGGPAAVDPGRVRSVVKPQSAADAATEACRKQYNNKPMPSTIN